jgi:hypothetical protein
MTTWAHLRGYIENNYKIAADDGDRLSLLCNVGDMRSQLLIVYSVEQKDGTEWFFIESGIGKVGQVDLLDAARTINGLVCGALAVSGDYVIVRHSAPVADLNAEEFEKPFWSIAHTADELERRLVGGDSF